MADGLVDSGGQPVETPELTTEPASSNGNHTDPADDTVVASILADGETEDILQQALHAATDGHDFTEDLTENEAEVVDHVAVDEPEHDPNADLALPVGSVAGFQTNIDSSPVTTQVGTHAVAAIAQQVQSSSAKQTPALGSKSNPIRIIQQGNTYTSMQDLTQEQIQQIVHVLQQQNIAAKGASGAQTAVYNPETNTRIVYRVVQPHEQGLTAQEYHAAKYGDLGKRSNARCVVCACEKLRAVAYASVCL